MSQPVKNRSHWTIRKFESHEELRCQQVRDWQALSGAKRRGSSSWELVVDYWVGMKVMHPDELRLQRSVTQVITAKKTAGRLQDLADLDELRRADT